MIRFFAACGLLSSLTAMLSGVLQVSWLLGVSGGVMLFGNAVTLLVKEMPMSLRLRLEQYGFIKHEIFPSFITHSFKCACCGPQTIMSSKQTEKRCIICNKEMVIQ